MKLYGDTYYLFSTGPPTPASGLQRPTNSTHGGSICFVTDTAPWIPLPIKADFFPELCLSLLALTTLKQSLFTNVMACPPDFSLPPLSSPTSHSINMLDCRFHGDRDLCILFFLYYYEVLNELNAVYKHSNNHNKPQLTIIGKIYFHQFLPHLSPRSFRISAGCKDELRRIWQLQKSLHQSQANASIASSQQHALNPEIFHAPSSQELAISCLLAGRRSSSAMEESGSLEALQLTSTNYASRRNQGTN